MKSLAMLNLNRMSPDTGRTLALKLDTLSKNVLYTTHQVDKILELLKTLTVDKDLQNTVDQYFEKEKSDFETSHQTDLEE